MSNLKVDITKLTGDWKAWAEEANTIDNGGNGDINVWTQAEIDYVKNKAITAGKSNAEINEIFGLEMTTETKPTDNTPTVVFQEIGTPDKKQAKAMQKRTITALKTAGGRYLADNSDLTNTMNLFTNIVFKENKATKQNLIDSLPKNSYFQKLENAIADLANKTNLYLTSKEDIETNFKRIEKEIKQDKNDDLKDFKLDILETFKSIALTYQRETENSELIKKYSDLRTEQGKSRVEAYKLLKNEYKGKGSFYPELLKKFEETEVMKDAREDVSEAINRQRTGSENAPKTSREVEKAIKKDNALEKDKYTRKVMRGRGELSFSEQVDFEQSSYKAERKEAAAHNRVESQKQHKFTANEITDVLRNDQIFYLLTSEPPETTDNNGQKVLPEPLIKPNYKQDEEGALRPDGTYDITNLSNALKLSIGADKALNKQKRENYPYSEVENAIKAILNRYGDTNTKISKHDVVALAKLCGYDYRGNSFWLNLWKETVGGLANAGNAVLTASLVGAKATGKFVGNKGPYTVHIPYTTQVPFKIDIVNNTHFTITFTTNNSALTANGIDVYRQLFRQFGSNAKYEQFENGFKIIVDASETYTQNLLKTWSGIATGEVSAEELGINFDDDIKAQAKKDKKLAMAIGIGIALGMAALQAAFRESGEKAVTVTQCDESKTFDQYMTDIDNDKKLNGMQKDALQTMARAFKVDNKWDVHAYNQFLNKIAGDESFLNPAELLNGLNRLKKADDAFYNDNIPAKNEKSNDKPTAQQSTTTQPSTTTQEPDADNTEDDCYNVQKEDDGKATLPIIQYRTGTWYIANGYIHADGTNLNSKEIKELQGKLSINYHLNAKGKRDGLIVANEITLDSGKKVKLANDAAVRIKKLEAHGGGKDPKYNTQKKGGKMRAVSCDASETPLTDWITPEKFAEWEKNKKKK